jgi:metallopeptidase MepB
VTLRAEYAKLLGYESYADYRSEDKAMNFKSLNSFFAGLRVEIASQAVIEMGKMRAFSRVYQFEHGAESIDDQIYP